MKIINRIDVGLFIKKKKKEKIADVKLRNKVNYLDFSDNDNIGNYIMTIKIPMITVEIMIIIGKKEAYHSWLTLAWLAWRV